MEQDEISVTRAADYRSITSCQRKPRSPAAPWPNDLNGLQTFRVHQFNMIDPSKGGASLIVLRTTSTISRADLFPAPQQIANWVAPLTIVPDRSKLDGSQMRRRTGQICMTMHDTLGSQTRSFVSFRLLWAKREKCSSSLTFYL